MFGLRRALLPPEGPIHRALGKARFLCDRGDRRTARWTRLPLDRCLHRRHLDIERVGQLRQGRTKHVGHHRTVETGDLRQRDERFPVAQPAQDNRAFTLAAESGHRIPHPVRFHVRQPLGQRRVPQELRHPALEMRILAPEVLECEPFRRDGENPLRSEGPARQILPSSPLERLAHNGLHDLAVAAGLGRQPVCDRLAIPPAQLGGHLGHGSGRRCAGRSRTSIVGGRVRSPVHP